MLAVCVYRFSPCVFIYLLTVVPPIWLLHLDYLDCAAASFNHEVQSALDDRRDGHCTDLLTGNNSTVCVSRLSKFSLHRLNKRSKNFDKRPNRRQKKILRQSQDRGKAVDNGLSVGKVVQFLLYGKNASSVSREYVRHA